MSMVTPSAIRYGISRSRRRPAPANIRVRRRVLIGIMGSFALLALFASVMALINGRHSWELAAAPLHDVPGAWRVLANYGDDTTIQPGAVIVQIDGHPPASLAEINQADTLEAQIPGQATLYVATWRPSQSLDTLASVCWMALGGLCFLLGVLVFLHATERQLAARFFWLMTTLALGALLEPESHISIALSTLAAGLLGGLFFGLLVNFLWLLLRPATPRLVISTGQHTGVTRRVLRHRSLPDLIVVMGGLIAISLFVAVEWNLFGFFNFVAIWGNSVAAIDTCICLAILLTSGFSRRPGIARERARLLLGGILVTMLPVLLLTILPWLLFGQILLNGVFSALPVVLVLPLTFAYAFMKRDLLPMDSRVYQTVILLLTFIGGIVVAVLISIFLGLLPSAFSPLLGAVGLGMMLPTYYGARWVTETWLFPQVRHYRRMVAEAEMLEHTGNDPARVAQQLIGEVHLHLPVRDVALYTPQKEAESFSPLIGEEAPLLLEDAVLIDLLKMSDPVLVEPHFPTPTPASRNSADPPPATALDTFSAAAKEIPDKAWQVLVPLGTHGLAGILALGKRDDGQPYSQTELRILSLLARRRAGAIEHDLQFEDVRLALEQRLDQDHLRRLVFRGAREQVELRLDIAREQVARLQQFWSSPEREKAPEEAFRPLWQTLDSFADGLAQIRDDLEQPESAPILERRVVDLRDLMLQVVGRLEPLARDRGMTIRCKLPDNLQALGDEAAMRYIIQRLLTNAVESSRSQDVFISAERGEIRQHVLAPPPGRQVEQGQSPHTFSLRAETQERSEGVKRAIVEVVVRDSGEPIAPQLQPLLFTYFGKQHPTRRGLPRVREVVQAMGGETWIESDELARSIAHHVVLPCPTEAAPPSNGSAFARCTWT